MMLNKIYLSRLTASMLRILVMLIYLASSVLIPVHASAISKEQKKLLNKNVLYFNYDECSNLNQQSTDIGGGPVYMMGDSITAGAKSDLENEFKNIKMEVSKINGVVSRSFTSKGEGTENGLEAIDKDKSDITSSNTIIIALGTNGEDAPGESKTFKGHAAEALDKIKQFNPNAKIYWVNLFSDSPPIKQKSDYNDVIDNLDGVTVIDMDSENISLADKIHPDAAGYKKYAKKIAESVKSDTSSTNSGGGKSELDGHKLPATKGGTGLETAVTAAGTLVGSSEKVTFSQHAALGKEYRDYYINMRWNYVKWNWDGTTGGSVNNSEYNWFADKPRLVLVTNPETKKSIIAAAIETGPAPWTGVDSGVNNNPKQGWSNPQEGTPPEYKGRVSGLPPEAFNALGMTSNDQRTAGGKGPDLLYSWAPDQSAKPGPTQLSVDGSASDTSKSECSCNTGKSQNVAGGDVDKFIKALAFQESGGDPNQPGSAGGARGKYQYIDSTWRSSAQTYYKPALQYATANQAPEEVQDAVAFLEYSKKFKDLNNDLFKLAVSHFYPAANSDPGLLDIIPPSNVITPRQYASKLLDSIKNGGDWEKIPLKYTEAPEFSKYAKGVSVSDASVNDSSGSTLSSELCSTEGDSDNTGVDGVAWPLDVKYWKSNPDWFTKPHHDYAASDIPVGPGTKVYAMTEGKVLLAGDNGGCGISVVMQYTNNVVIQYCHGTPGSTKVQTGDTVRPGQLVMLSGYTGHIIPSGPAGAHLHVQIKVNGELRCPQDAFKALGANKKPDFEKLANSGCSY